MKEIRKSAIAVFNEEGELLRVDILGELPQAAAIISATETYVGADFKKVEPTKPAPVTLNVHGSNFKAGSKFNKSKP